MATNKGGKVGLAVALATAIAIPAEGLRRIAYYDPPGILTVCYGSTSGVIAGKRYTMDECKARLDRDMLHAVEQVDRCAPNAASARYVVVVLPCVPVTPTVVKPRVGCS